MIKVYSFSWTDITIDQYFDHLVDVASFAEDLVDGLCS